MEPTYRPIDDLHTGVETLRVHLDDWNDGAYVTGRKHQRLAASDALDTIDAVLRELYTMRSGLVTQMRKYDDETMRRTDDLLREIRAERQVAQS